MCLPSQDYMWPPHPPKEVSFSACSLPSAYGFILYLLQPDSTLSGHSQGHLDQFCSTVKFQWFLKPFPGERQDQAGCFGPKENTAPIRASVFQHLPYKSIISDSNAPPHLTKLVLPVLGQVDNVLDIAL